MPRVHEQLSENELVLLCRHGDEEAIGALYDRFGRPAFGLALAMLECERAAEDAVADGFAEFWRTVSSAAAPEDASRLLMTLVHRAAVRRVRRDGIPAAANCDRLQPELLPDLPEEERRVIVLAYFGGLREREVAARLVRRPDRKSVV